MRKTILVAVLAASVGAVVAAPVAVYASHSFTDVPDSNTFHEDIAWLEAAGVTKGCNPPANTEFCPKDEVTREQMAAFMHRLADNRVVDADTVDGQHASAFLGVNAQAADSDTVDGQHAAAFLGVNAQAADSDKLDGLDAAQLVPRAAFNNTDNTSVGAGEDYTLSTEITVPARGVLLMTGGVDAGALTTDQSYFCSLEIDNDRVTGSFMGATSDGASSVNVEEDCTTSGAAVVDAGTYTIDFEVDVLNIGVSLKAASVWALWVPFDGTGSVPASLTD